MAISKETSEATYKASGVDIEAANQLVDDIKTIAAPTLRPEVVKGVGGFGALFEIPQHYQKPVLVSGTDGVGTKLKLALEYQQHAGIGIDLVAMCVNDIITTGAEPLFFLDYYATGKLELTQAKTLLQGIATGCREAGMSLIGGETAELPGMYQGNDYDLAGFCVGVVEKDQMIDGSTIQVGDSLLAIASSGPHANGFSLIRHIIEQAKPDLMQKLQHTTLLDALLAPTKIYARTLLQLQKSVCIKGAAHITGGGLVENVPRMLPLNTQAVLLQASWQQPEIFAWLQQLGNVADLEMLKTFNVGVGMVICISQADADEALSVLSALGEIAWQIGHIEACPNAKPQAILR